VGNFPFLGVFLLDQRLGCSIEDLPEELEDVLDVALEAKAALEAGNQNATARAVPAPTTSLPPPNAPQNASRVRSPHPERRLLDVSNEALMKKCRAFVEQLRDGAAPWIVQKLSDSYGNMPTDAPSFGFWIALVSFNGGWSEAENHEILVRSSQSTNTRKPSYCRSEALD